MSRCEHKRCLGRGVGVLALLRDGVLGQVVPSLVVLREGGVRGRVGGGALEAAPPVDMLVGGCVRGVLRRACLGGGRGGRGGEAL